MFQDFFFVLRLYSPMSSLNGKMSYPFSYNAVKFIVLELLFPKEVLTLTLLKQLCCLIMRIIKDMSGVWISLHNVRSKYNHTWSNGLYLIHVRIYFSPLVRK